jgi:hypothetical protein
MNEVTPNNEVLKSSVFHRLLQRAFPEWFPYDSIRFFHPFYTAQKNSQLAKEQGYDKDFKIKNITTPFSRQPTFDVAKSNPTRPTKPVILQDRSQIIDLLQNHSDKVVHPARLTLQYLPKEVEEVLKPGQTPQNPGHHKFDVQIDDNALMKYFTDLTKDIIQREFITMDAKRPVYQIDVVKE